MEKKLIDNFVAFCKSNLPLDDYLQYVYPYRSLSVCIIDCIYSLRTKYFPVTVPILQRYADAYMHGDVEAANDNLIDLVNHIDNVGGCTNFAETVLNNKQKLSGRLKSEICYELAQKLLQLGINTMEDFKNFERIDVLESTIRSVKGIGPAGLNYLFMLAGDPNRCKPDVHIHHCVKDACGTDLSDSDCQVLFTEAIKILNKSYPGITVRQLDGMIWKKYEADTHKQ